MPKIAAVVMSLFMNSIIDLQSIILKFNKIAALDKVKSLQSFRKIIVINTTILYVCVIIVNHENLIIGAGRSASSLIQYLLRKSEVEKLHL
jgi:hypothetical protein